MTDRTGERVPAWTPEQVLTPEQVAKLRAAPVTFPWRVDMVRVCDSHEGLRAERDDLRESATDATTRMVNANALLTAARTRIAELEGALRDVKPWLDDYADDQPLVARALHALERSDTAESPSATPKEPTT